MNNVEPTSIYVDVLSNTMKYNYTLEIYPLSICGNAEYTHSGRIVKNEGCKVGSQGHETAGGRYKSVIEVPDGYELHQLTSGGAHSVRWALSEMGENPSDYMADDTVHSEWKVQCRQAVVLVKKENK